MKDFKKEICMIRTFSAGVHFGEILERNGREVLLKNAHRVHYWDGACSLSQLASDGSRKRENCRISVVVPEILLLEVVEIIPMSMRAIENLTGGKIWKI